ncbi:hypothetical protein ACGFIW_19855 [Micromonospora sp. NPDC048935]
MVTPAGEQVLHRARRVVQRIQDVLLATLPEQDREGFLPPAARAHATG